MRPSLEWVQHSADSLAQTGLKRGERFAVIQWMAVKWAGGRPGQGPVGLDGARMSGVHQGGVRRPREQRVEDMKAATA
jgi:hypothetical protein